MPNYNNGQIYEEIINEILIKRGLLPNVLHGNDSGFLHKGKSYYLEIKNKSAPDFGQRGLVWSADKGWEWRKEDLITQMLDEIRIKDLINPNFSPRRYLKQKEKITVDY